MTLSISVTADELAHDSQFAGRYALSRDVGHSPRRRSARVSQLLFLNARRLGFSSREFLGLVTLEERSDLIDDRGLQLGRLAPGEHR